VITTDGILERCIAGLSYLVIGSLDHWVIDLVIQAGRLQQLTPPINNQMTHSMTR
jgi:hypothetical protein